MATGCAPAPVGDWLERTGGALSRRTADPRGAASGGGGLLRAVDLRRRARGVGGAGRCGGADAGDGGRNGAAAARTQPAVAGHRRERGPAALCAAVAWRRSWTATLDRDRSSGVVHRPGGHPGAALARCACGSVARRMAACGDRRARCAGPGARNTARPGAGAGARGGRWPGPGSQPRAIAGAPGVVPPVLRGRRPRGSAAGSARSGAPRRAGHPRLVGAFGRGRRWCLARCGGPGDGGRVASAAERRATGGGGVLRGAVRLLAREPDARPVDRLRRRSAARLRAAGRHGRSSGQRRGGRRWWRQPRARHWRRVPSVFVPAAQVTPAAFE